MTWRTRRLLVLPWLTALVASFLFEAPRLGAFGGIGTLLIIGGVTSSVLLLLHDLLTLVGFRRNRPGALTCLQNLLLAWLSVVFCLLAAELLLVVLVAASDRPNPLVLPAEWRLREVSVSGAARAFYWHGALHVYWEEVWFRRTCPFPARRSDTGRIMLVGDSLTYGYGVPLEATYGYLLEQTLSHRYRLEVLNLGHCGHQSGGVLHVVRTFLPRLQPDLVVYGICLNDLLPQGRPQHRRLPAGTVPLPRLCKEVLQEQTLLGMLLARVYDQLLIRIGVRSDFYDEMLLHLDRYEPGFRRDLAQINQLVEAQGLPPVIALVLDQVPVLGGKGQRLALLAEAAAAEAGMRVVPTAGYYRQHHGQDLRVSHWEGHPNRQAHQLFAELLLPVLESSPVLEPYARKLPKPPGWRR